MFLTILIGFGLLLAVEFIVPHLAKGAIIGLAAKSHRHEKVEGGLVLALYNFFPILAIHEFLVLAGWPMAVSVCSLILRYIDSNLRLTMVGLVIFIFFFSNILKFLFSFAEPAIVIRKAGIFEAMGQSLKLIVSYLSQVMFLLLLLFIISIRIFINTVIVLILPVIIVGLAFLLTTFLSTLLAYIAAGILGMGLVVAASVLFAYLHVFNETVWTITYMQLRKHKDLDHIE